MANLKQFENQQFLALETFRKSGLGVKTPVWFARDGDALYIWTEAQSGKAKRIRINPDVKIAPAKADGTPVGEWIPAKAQADESDQAMKHVKGLFKKKYGMMFNIFALSGIVFVEIRGINIRAIKRLANKAKMTGTPIRVR